MKVKRSDIYKMRNGLQTLKLNGRKFTYVIDRNKEFIEQEFRNSEKFKEPSEDFLKFQDELEALRKEHAEKDKKGNPITKQIMQGGRQVLAYDIKDVDDEDSPFRKDVDKLEKKYEKVLEDHNNKMDEFHEKFMEEEVDIRLIKIHWNDVPESIGQDGMSAIRPFLVGVPEELNAE